MIIETYSRFTAALALAAGANTSAKRPENRRALKGVCLLLLVCGFVLTGCNTSSLTATPNPMDFGAIRIGQTKDMTLSVTFAGMIMGTYMAVDSGANPGDFQIVSQNVVGGTGTRAAVIRFTPTASGPRSATLTIQGGGGLMYTRTVALTGSGIAPLAASLAGAALQFDGATGRVVIPHNSALNALPFTAEAWINTLQTGGDAAIAGKYANGSFNGWQMGLHNGLFTAAYFHDSANYVGDGGAYTFTGGNVADGNWHHVAFTVDNTGGTLYVDGISGSHLAWHGTSGPCSAAQNVTLGALSDGSSLFAGHVDEVRLWNTARTPAQIQVNMRATQKENETALIAYYRLDEGHGTAITDATANHFDGTLTGSALWLNSSAPVDTVIVAPGQPRAFTAAGFEINGKALTFAAAFPPAQGTLSVNSPAMTYTPGADFMALDTFTYTASNGASVSNPATVRLLYRTSGANTLLVPTQYATIQAAVNVAATGDTILVANGTYTGAGNHDINFGGKDLIVKSVGGSALCIIDCQQSGRAFYFHTGETSASRVDGFTIRNGNPPDVYGGGVYATNSNPTVANCLFLNNKVLQLRPAPYDNGYFIDVGYGAGMCGGVAFNCVFLNNSAGTLGGGMYGGVAFNCVFLNNSAETAGGGMYNGTAVNCTFTGNSALFGSGIEYGTATSCILWGNSVYSTTVTYSDVQGGYAGTGNIDADPLFVNAASGDLHLMTGSPCIDAGTATALPPGVTLPVTDFDGKPRIIGSAPDMGAFEFGAAAPVAVTGRVTLEGVPDLYTINSAATKGSFTVSFRKPGTTTEVYSVPTTIGLTANPAIGSFTLPAVPPGTYDVAIKGWKWLRVSIPNVAVYAPLTLPAVLLPAGDANGDNSVDATDFGIFVSAYNSDSSVPGSGYDGNADFNMDGLVDPTDFSLFVGNYGSVGAP